MAATKNVLERIRSKSVEEGDCVVWAGFVKSGVPYMKVSGVMLPVRRVLAQEIAGGPLKAGRVYTARCGNPHCVSLEHTRVLTLSQHLKRVAGKGCTKSENPSRARRISAAKRARNAKLTIEKVREIRARPEPSRVIAAEFGVCKATVQRIRAGKVWVDYASPWAALLAA